MDERSRLPILEGGFSTPSLARMSTTWEDIEESMELAVALPAASSEKRRGRKTMKHDGVLDENSDHSQEQFKATWNLPDTLALIDAVKKVEDDQLMESYLGISPKKSQRTPQDGKWHKVASLLPNCWMSRNDRFYLMCRGKFSELRRNYQKMLRNQAVRKFFSPEVCQKMEDYLEAVPPPHFLQTSASHGTEQVEEIGRIEPAKEIAFGTRRSARGIPSSPPSDYFEGNNSPEGTRTSPFFDSGEILTLRRSSRIPKRSCRLESPSYDDEQVEEMDSVPDSINVHDHKGTRSAKPLTSRKPQNPGPKRARVEVPASKYLEAPVQGKTITELVQRQFDLFRVNIDSSFQKHLDREFKAFEGKIVSLIKTVDRKVESLDKKVEALMTLQHSPSE